MPNKKQLSWLYGLLIGLGVGLALYAAVGSIPVAAGVGIGMVVLFAVGVFGREADG